MKYFFEDTKLDVKQIQSEWEQEFSRLGNLQRLGFAWKISSQYAEFFNINIL